MLVEPYRKFQYIAIKVEYKHECEGTPHYARGRIILGGGRLPAFHLGSVSVRRPRHLHLQGGAGFGCMLN